MGMVGPDVVVVEERPLQSLVHFAGGRPGGRTGRRAGCGCCARRCRDCRGCGVGGHARGMPASRRAVSNSCMNQEPPSTCTELTGRRCRASWRKAVAAVALERTLTWMPLVRVLGVELLEGSAVELSTPSAGCMSGGGSITLRSWNRSGHRWSWG